MVTFARSALSPTPRRGSISKFEIPARVRVFVKFRVPIELPGASVPPVNTVLVPTVPVPLKVPPVFTLVWLLVEMLPLMTSEPALTVIAPA